MGLLPEIFAAQVVAQSTEPTFDLTFLSVAFGFNAALSVVDCFVRDLIGRMQVWFGKRARVAKNECERRVEGLEKRKELASEQIKRSFLEVDAYVADLPAALDVDGFVVKIAMSLAAALAAVFMIIPYTGRLTILLLVPFPGFVFWSFAKLQFSYSRKVQKALKAVATERNALGIKIGKSPRERVTEEEQRLVKLLGVTGSFR